MSSHFFSTFGKKLLVSFIITIMIIPAHSNPIVAVDKVSNQKQYDVLNDHVIIKIGINTYLLIYFKQFILGLSNDIEALCFRIM